VGDWLVDYGDGSLGVVSPAIFATTYEILDRRAQAERRPMALHQLIQRLLLGRRGSDLPAAPAPPSAPPALQPLIDAVANLTGCSTRGHWSTAIATERFLGHLPAQRRGGAVCDVAPGPGLGQFTLSLHTFGAVGAQRVRADRDRHGDLLAGPPA